MGEYRPTEIAVTLARINRDAAFIQADIADDKINDRLLDYECRSTGTTVDELDTANPSEQKELEAAINQISVDPNDEYEQVMKMVQENKPKMSIDDVMGVAADNEEAVLEELMNCCE